MKLSVFLPSHNKGGFAVEAVRSVQDQDFGDYELWILENSTDDGRTRNLLRKYTDLPDPRVRYCEIDLADEIRQQHIAVAYILNEYYPKAQGEVILYLSDDDIFMPGLFRSVADYFDANPTRDALYFNLARTIAHSAGQGISWGSRWLGIDADIVRGETRLDCKIDGGQVAYRKSVLYRISKPWFYTGKQPETACHADGLHLEAIAQAGVEFYPLAVPGVIHRHTPVSVWSKDH